MTINRGLSRWMCNVNSITEAIKTNSNTRYIAIGDGIDVFPLDIVGLDIETTMKVVRTWLTKIARQRDVVIYWRDKYI